MTTRAGASATVVTLGTDAVWLVRHAATDWTGRRWCGRSDPELSDTGRSQSRRLAVALAAELGEGAPGRPVVLSSPLRRATQTADEIARALGATVRIEASLVEVDFGVADGLTWHEVTRREPALAAALIATGDPDWPGGETAAAVIQRASLAARRISAIVEEGPLVVVSHGGLLRALGTLVEGGGQLGSLAPGAVERTRWRRST